MKNFLSFLFIGIFSTVLIAQNANKQSNNNNIFAFELLKTLSSKSENVFISPYSISSALAMTYLGAKNNTKTAIDNTLHFNKTTPKSFKTLNSIMQSYNDTNLVLNIANALWIDKSLKLKYCFKSKNKKYFKSQPYVKTTAKEINKWASDNTNNKIKEIVDENDVKNSLLILTNAVYFNGEWKYPFVTKSTKKEKFTTTNNKEIIVDMMYNKEHYNYFENENLQAIELAYKGNNISMIVILPKNSDINLNNQIYSKIISGLKKEQIKLHIPKFEFESAFKLKDPLSEMGMAEPFSSSANFSGISKTQLFIDDVIHKTFIGVNEKGTEAAAVTAVIMRTTSAPTKPIKSFKANKTFTVIIKDIKTNSILFIGNIINPNL